MRPAKSSEKINRENRKGKHIGAQAASIGSGLADKRGRKENEQEDEERRRKNKTKRETRAVPRIRVPLAEFPSRKSPYPPTSILVPADGNEISICIRASPAGLSLTLSLSFSCVRATARNSPGKVNNDLKFSQHHRWWQSR